jgi:metallo-beta-lactamase family protein
MKLSFHGADRGVTGSCHLIECAGKRILVDCGLYQGSRELHEENGEPFGFEAESIDYVLLTHAHLDHCGRLPLLVKRGFNGEIVTTAASRELTRVVLVDAAHLQEEEAQRHGRRTQRRGQRHVPGPLYGTVDAFQTMEQFGRTVAYGKALSLTTGVTATFLDAGHILGSASVHLECTEGGARHAIAFSGDLGNGGRPLLRDPVPPPHCDSVIIETTYGDRLHKPVEPSVEELYRAIGDTLDRGGNVIIPTFALERAQELLYFLREGLERRRLPRRMQVFLDSPMAVSATGIFERHPQDYSARVAAMFQAGRDPFDLPGLRFVRDASESRGLNRITSGAVIMAGSGMCTGGRVRHHLKHNLWREECSVVFVGYAARGTLARQIIDGAPMVRIFGEEVNVRAQVHTINGFSAHADRDELLAWHRRIAPKRTFLVHGEEEVMRRFAEALERTQVQMPTPGETVEL